MYCFVEESQCIFWYSLIRFLCVLRSEVEKEAAPITPTLKEESLEPTVKTDAEEQQHAADGAKQEESGMSLEIKEAEKSASEDSRGKVEVNNVSIY